MKSQRQNKTDYGMKSGKGMKGKNVAMAVAAGVAAAVVVGIVMKRTGALNALMDKLRDLADSVERKFASQDTMGMQDIIPKGEDKNISRKVQHHQN